MALIQVTPDSLRIEAGNVRKYKAEQQEVMQQIRNVVTSLNESWKGEAQEAFVAKFLSMDSIYHRFAEVLEDYAKVMDMAAADFQSEDQSLKNHILNLR